jgi:LacI family transcriptional regulator
MHEGTGHSKALCLLDSEDPPTAFLCSSLAQAAGVRRACLDRGLRAGQDLALIAHDDRLQEMRAETFEPPLTTTQSPIGDAGRRIVELLVAMLRDPKQALPAEVWPVDLVVRNSTPAPKR